MIDGGFRPDASVPDAGISLEEREPVSAHVLLLDVHGLVNTYGEAMDEMHATYARAEARIHLEDQDFLLRDDPLVFTYRYPEDHPNPALRGMEILVMEVERWRSRSAAEYVGDKAQLLLDKQALERIVTQGETNVTAQDGLRANVKEETAFIRADRVVLSRSCYVGLLDKADPRSALVLDTDSTTGFEHGKLVRASANVALITDRDGLGALLGQMDQYDGKWCTCYRNSQPMPCSSWDAEVTMDPWALSCQAPVDFDAPASSDHAVIHFKGTINDATSRTVGTGSMDVAFNANTVQLEYSTYANRATAQSGTHRGKDYITITALGGMVPLSSTRYTYNFFTASTLVESLTALKASGQHHQSPAPLFLSLYQVEQATVEEVEYLQACLVATEHTDPAPAMVLCHDANQTFSAGENLEIGINAVLVADRGVLGSLRCTCYRNDIIIDCTEMPPG